MKRIILIVSLVIINFSAFSQTFQEHLINQPIALPSGTSSGDFDNDGDIDIVATSSAGEVVLYLNNGSESFDEVIYIEDHMGSNNENKNIAAGDLNGDGLIDIVTASGSGGKLFYYKNLGNNEFQKVQISSSYNGSDSRIIIEDVDNDHDLDIITNNSGSIIVLINEGNFQFNEYLISLSGFCYDLRCADINGDHKTDIFAATQNSLEFYTQGTNYSFNNTIIESTGYVSLDLGDVDLDGNIDIIVTAKPFGVFDYIYLFLNNGNFTFSKNQLYDGTDVNLIDIDGDTKKDLLYINSSDNGTSSQEYRFSVILNENLTSFNSSTDIIVINGGAVASHFGGFSFNDFNEDGAMDIIETHSNFGRVQLYLSDLSGALPLSNLISLEVSNSSGDVYDISVADFDGDGDSDIVSSDCSDNDIDWYENNNFQFQKRNIDFVYNQPIKNEAIDLDGDGDIDIVACQKGASSDNNHWFMWYENDGTGSFIRHNIFAINNGGANPKDVKVADLDNDGDLDIVGVGYPKTRVFFNDGDENFTDYIISGLSSNKTYTAAIADLNGDSSLDIILTNNSGRISWCENNGNQTFNAPVELSPNTYQNVYSIEIADMDNDNDLDILHTSSAYRKSVSFLRNDGNMTYSESTIVQNVVDTRVIKLEDINNDNYNDIILGSNTGLLIFKNDQNGAFIKKSILVDQSPYANIFSLQIEDFDNDGDPDIIYGSYGGDRIAWLEMTSYENTISWTGSSNNNWNKTNNWIDSEIPTPTDNVIIPANLSKYPTLSGATEINDLKMELNASLKGQENLTINGTLSIEREISAYSSNSDGWHFLSSPVSNQTIAGSDFAPSSSQDDLFQFGEATGEWQNYYDANFSDTQFEVGKGYLVAYNSTETKEFSGSFNTGPVTKNLTYTSSQGDGWNLLGNPYPSAIDWDLITRSGDVDNAVYIVNPVDGTYKTWVDGAGDITNGEIPVNQGFFVKANSGGQSVTMKLADQVHSSNNFNKSSQDQVDNLLKISLTGTHSSNNTYVRLNTNASQQFDSQSDAYKLFGFAEIPQVYTHLNDVDYSINSFNFTTEPVSIPLGIYLNAEEDLSFDFSGINGFNDNIRIELEDKLENEMINLKDQNTYSFRGTSSDEADRFLLHFSQVTGVENIEAQDAQVYAADGRVYIRLEEGASYSQMNIFDLSGKLIKEQNLNKQSLQSFDMNELKGVYLVQLLGENRSVTEKVTL